jgi:hypothetical protein
MAEGGNVMSKPINGLTYLNCQHLTCPTWSGTDQFVHDLNSQAQDALLILAAALLVAALVLWLLGPRSPLGRVYRLWARIEGTCVRRYGP